MDDFDITQHGDEMTGERLAELDKIGAEIFALVPAGALRKPADALAIGARLAKARDLSATDDDYDAWLRDLGLPFRGGTHNNLRELYTLFGTAEEAEKAKAMSAPIWGSPNESASLVR